MVNYYHYGETEARIPTATPIAPSDPYLEAASIPRSVPPITLPLPERQQLQPSGNRSSGYERSESQQSRRGQPSEYSPARDRQSHPPPMFTYPQQLVEPRSQLFSPEVLFSQAQPPSYGPVPINPPTPRMNARGRVSQMSSPIDGGYGESILESQNAPFMDSGTPAYVYSPRQTYPFPQPRAVLEGTSTNQAQAMPRGPPCLIMTPNGLVYEVEESSRRRVNSSSI